MKALSIQQPWADLILYRGKDIENRTWRLPVHMLGQRVHVHAGKRIDRDACEWYDIPVDQVRLRTGALLGTVLIVACVTRSSSEWFNGPYGFVLADPEPYAEPVPCRGRLGFFSAAKELVAEATAKPDRQESLDL